jgi:hypothetical protein
VCGASIDSFQFLFFVCSKGIFVAGVFLGSNVVSFTFVSFVCYLYRFLSLLETWLIIKAEKINFHGIKFVVLFGQFVL